MSDCQPPTIRASKYLKPLGPVSCFRIAALLLVICQWVSCILPPVNTGGAILDKKELDTLTSVALGKDYSSRGRMDLAEIEFRKALEISPNSPQIRNDLAFSLQGQNRLEESRIEFEAALNLDPENLNVRDNLARVYYNLGEYRLALVQFFEIQNLLERYPLEVLQQRVGDSLAASSVAEIDRRVADVFLAAGAYDEAICYSARSLALKPSIDEAILHARLLMASGKNDAAAKTLAATIAVHGNSLPGELFLDYALSLVGQQNQSQVILAAVRKALSSSLNQSRRRVARLLELRLLSEPDEVQYTIELLGDDEPEICQELLVDAQSRGVNVALILDPEQYWPLEVTEFLQGSLNEYCKKIEN